MVRLTRMNMRKKTKRKRYYSPSFVSHNLFSNVFLSFVSRENGDETVGVDPISEDGVEKVEKFSSDNEVLSHRVTRLALRKIYFESNLLSSILFLIDVFISVLIRRQKGREEEP